jgi:hypothetical protein
VSLPARNPGRVGVAPPVVLASAAHHVLPPVPPVTATRKRSADQAVAVAAGRQRLVRQETSNLLHPTALTSLTSPSRPMDLHTLSMQFVELHIGTRDQQGPVEEARSGHHMHGRHHLAQQVTLQPYLGNPVGGS